jgi:isocitrate dehydrogenase
MRQAIKSRRVTYDLARHVEGATTIKCSEFAGAIISRIDEAG